MHIVLNSSNSDNAEIDRNGSFPGNPLDRKLPKNIQNVTLHFQLRVNWPLRLNIAFLTAVDSFR